MTYCAEFACSTIVAHPDAVKVGEGGCRMQDLASHTICNATGSEQGRDKISYCRSRMLTESISESADRTGSLASSLMDVSRWVKVWKSEEE